jgi:hypothetical protein
MWMRIARAIGALLTPVVAAAIYFAVITPVGWLRRSFGSDPLSLHFDRDAASYRVPSRRSPPAKMQRPY